MVFKGTQQRTAAEIAALTDAIGGQLNAYTTKELTCFYARVLDNHLDQAMDILCDMVFHSRFAEEDVATERGVILEEIGMYADTPDDLCSERLFASIYKGSSLARPILGKPATLTKLTGDYLREYQQRHYLGGDIVVSLAGSFTHEMVDRLVERFAHLPAGRAPALTPAVYTPSVTVKKKAIEQNHLILAMPGLPYGSQQRFALQLLSSILGGGMSSRLFQQVRERQGLCYSIYSYGASHAETGVFAIYTALGKETEGRALSTICQVVRDFTEHGPEQAELDRAREQSKANVLMGLESTQAHMSHLGRSTLQTGTVLSVDEIIAAYDAVTCESVRALARQMFHFDQASLSAVGRVSSPEEYKELILQQAD
jgi:predicted Zn-dependent peptidase